MYACFGFSLARSRRARTIDLQCQSLSLRRAFLLRSVCLSCMCVSVSRSLAHVEQGRSTCNVSRDLSVEFFCFAACVCHCTEPSRVMPFAGRLTRKIKRKIIAKIDRKSIPGDTSGPPKSTQNRSGTLSGHTMASKSVPKASREGLWSVPEHPRRAAGVSGGRGRRREILCYLALAHGPCAWPCACPCGLARHFLIRLRETLRKPCANTFR